MKKALAVIILLTGCTAEHRAAVTYAEENAKAFDDTEARILMLAPCAMRLGAYLRLGETRREAAKKLCEL